MITTSSSAGHLPFWMITMCCTANLGFPKIFTLSSTFQTEKIIWVMRGLAGGWRAKRQTFSRSRSEGCPDDTEGGGKNKVGKNLQDIK